MRCWNGLSECQQEKLVTVGTLEFGYTPEGWCSNRAQVGIETRSDEAPAPRFYCYPCGIEYLQRKANPAAPTFVGRVMQYLGLR
jgi:hypothetical protein